MNNPTANPKIFKQALKLAVLLFVLALVIITPATTSAATPGSTAAAASASAPSVGGAGAIRVLDQAVLDKAAEAAAEAEKGWLKQKLDKLKDWFRQDWWKKLEDAYAVAWRAAFKNFLNNLAYDTATYLATGDKGQMPMFETQGWGGYLSNAADNAAGTFIESMGKEGGLGGIKFNLCNPNFNVMLKINLGLMQTVRPKKPACTFSQLTKNWDTALRDKNFLPKFQDMFNPWSNDLGIALTVQTGIENEVSKNINTATQARIEGQGWRPVRTAIDGNIKTPADLVGATARQPIIDSIASERVRTGAMVADSIDIFINTFAGKLLDTWLKGGLVNNFPPLISKLDSLTNPNAQNQNEGAAGAKDRLKTIMEPNFRVRADYDILAELTACPDPTKAGPTNCVIEEKFRQAIEKKLTVREALAQGYLNGNGIFGFTSDGLEPKFNEGYPYRSLIILRKYRIIPVGWETAAQIIKDRQGAGLGQVDGTKNLNDLVNCNSAWCADLVDPDWVLKAPQNFCKKEGAGPEIISEQVTGEGAESSLAILRNDAYCADEQSCIKEAADGSCRAYGYCTAEKRKWDFNAKSCEPLYNTCQSFGAPSTGSGQAVSYLENTLDFGICNFGNAGCQAYCRDYDFTLDKFTCTGTTGDKIHLNKQAESCDAESEGCRGLIRLNSGGGANLLKNSGFEELLTVGGWDSFGTVSSTAYQGANSLEKKAANANISYTIPVGAAGYNIAGESYSLSFYAKNCARISPIVGDTFWIGDASKSSNLNAGADWTRYNLTYTYPANANTNSVSFAINSSACLIDNIKLERGEQATSFSDYGSGSALIYEKIRPPYLLDAVCNGNNPPSECGNFARRCSADEAGCELYTSVTSDTKIPAKVIAQDYCPAACVGYNSFVQGATAFDSLRSADFIPRTAKTCSAEASGCDEFTNLDKISTTTPNVAEKKEYYSALRQCIKPNTAGQTCAEFYNWEGSDESGYQLKVESLKAAVVGANLEPVLTESDQAPGNVLCNERIYNLPSSDPAYKADCRQFYNTSGGISYHLYNRTIACTEDCHPYRRTEINVDENITTSGACTAFAVGGNWVNNQCIVCKSGGVWSADNNACIYMAVPSAGVACSAAQNGCREYTGNTGNNIRQVFTDDFSAGLGAWSGAAPSNEGIALGPDNQSHSIAVAAVALRPVGNTVGKGLDYVVNFVAKAAAGNPVLTFSLGNGLATSTFAANPTLTTAWQIFEINLTGLNHEPSAIETLRLEVGGTVYLDSLSLIEITDRYYLLKNSWRTPVSCDEVSPGVPSTGYMLGCSQYKDRADKTHNLKQFNKLCSESAVGCELMIDTQNSGNPAAETFTNDGTDIIVPKDEFTYAVYDAEKLCGAEEKGCERLGQSYKYESAALYSDIYLKNNPDKYGTILCGANAVGCDAFAYDNGAGSSGEKYFKDPGAMVCEWRQETATSTGPSWYKKKVKRCDDGTGGGIKKNGKIDATGNPLAPRETNLCLADADCAIEAGTTKHYACITDNNDYKCPVSNLKTLGLGGIGGSVSQPSSDLSGNWTGICQPADSGCSEYLDPVSKFNTNLIFNGSFQTLAVGPTDGWTNCPGGGFCQSVNLEPNTVYRLGRVKQNNVLPGALSITCPIATALYGISNNNALISPDHAISTLNATYENSTLFYYKGAALVSCTVKAGDANGAVELKEVAIDYQLRGNLDKQTCNGIVNPGQGCVLFNERKQSGTGLSALGWDADRTVSGNAPYGVAGAEDMEKDSNTILKVAPDRVCDQWLACKSYIKDAKGNNVCFDIGLCDAVDANGNCQSFIPSKKENQTVGGPLITAASISNLSGYAKVGISGSTLKTDYYPLGAMVQAGEVANFANGGFEYFGSNLYPIGWSWGNQGLNASWNANIFSVVNNPIAAQTEGIGYAREGASFLKLGSSYEAISEQIDVMPNTEYIITAYLNTKNLKSGTSSIDIATSTDWRVITQSLGNDWSFQMGKFTTGAGVSQIKVKLSATSTSAAAAGSEGNFYYDDIKIRPALNSKDNWFTAQTCRLYPQSDSLACDYFEASGKRQKGWPGYCLEYDRRPGDPNTCLLWYPIDKVKGDGIEEGAGYADKIPVYYCTAGTAEKVYEYRHAFYAGASCSGVCGGIACPNGYELKSANSCGDCGSSLIDQCYCVPKKINNIALDGTSDSNTDKFNCGPTVKVNSSNDGWYEYDGSLADINGVNYSSTNGSGSITSIGALNPFAKYLCNGKSSCTLTKELYRSKVSCAKVVQTVTATGQNKYWSSRVYKGSDYIVDPTTTAPAPVHLGLNYVYGTDAAPFGSMVPSLSLFNPYDWDGDLAKDGIQPIGYSTAEGAARSGQGYGCTPIADCGYVVDDGSKDNFPYAYGGVATTTAGMDQVKRLFAQSYGAWQWTGSSTIGRYIPIPNQGWGPPGTTTNVPNELNNGLCTGGVRPATQPGDFCAIPPAVSNIKVNSVTTPVNINKNGFINLTFNTKADSNQLPLVMYGVDWGDEGKTIVTGVEMRDKPNPEQPESVYHLYSYWDLKAKANQQCPGGSCNGLICAGGSRNGSSCSINCLTTGQCKVKPKIQIKDNWGWCNNGAAINTCGAGQWDSFAGEIIVKEK